MDAFFGHSSWYFQSLQKLDLHACSQTEIDGCPLLTSDDSAIADPVFLGAGEIDFRGAWCMTDPPDYLTE